MSATPAPRRDEERPEYSFPYAPEAEETILAATLQTGSMKHAEDLSPEEFYDTTRRRIFAAMRDLDRRGDLIPDKLKEVLTKGEPADTPAEESIAWRVDTLDLAEVGPLSLLPRKVAEIKNTALKRGMMLWHLDAARALNAGELDVPEHVKDVRARGEKWEATPSSDTKPVSARLKEIYESILTDKTKPVPTFSAALNKNLSGGLRWGGIDDSGTGGSGQDDLHPTARGGNRPGASEAGCGRLDRPPVCAGVRFGGNVRKGARHEELEPPRASGLLPYP